MAIDEVGAAVRLDWHQPDHDLSRGSVVSVSRYCQSHRGWSGKGKPRSVGGSFDYGDCAGAGDTACAVSLSPEDFSEIVTSGNYNRVTAREKRFNVALSFI